MGDSMLDTKDGETWVDRAYRLGVFLGYPPCCIHAFCTEDYTNRLSRKLCGTGYVPCEKCNENTEEELLSEISRLRKAETPFPESPWDVGIAP